MNNDNSGSTGGNIQQWGTFDIEAVDEGLDLASKGTSAMLKLKAGRNVLRFLPPPLGKRTIFAVVHQHFFELPGMAKKVSFNCPHLHGVGMCPVCRLVDKLRSTNSQADYELAGEMRAKLRVFANVIHRDQPDVGPQVFAFGKKVHDQLASLRKDATAGGDFTHPMNGFDIIIERKGTTKNDTEYTVKTARTSSPLGDLEWIAQQIDLTKYGRIPNADELRKILGDSGISSIAVGSLPASGVGL